MVSQATHRWRAKLYEVGSSHQAGVGGSSHQAGCWGEFLGENESQMMIFPIHGCWGIFFMSNEKMSMMVMRLVSPMVVFFRKMSHGR